MYHFKERDVYRFLGRPNDLKYRAYGAQLNTTDESPYFGDENYQYLRYLSSQLLRSPSVYCPDELGREQISWRSYGVDKLYKGFNPCHHVRSRIVDLPFGSLCQEYRYASKVWLNPYMRVAAPAYYPYDLDFLQHPDVDYQAARARAWHNMQPRFEGKVSMINFLFELKDFRDIAKYLFKRNKAIKDIRRLFSRKRTNLVPKDPSRGVATAILVNNFAIQPLIKDLAAIFQQMNVIVSEAQQKFFEAGSEFQTSHYTEEINRIDSRTPGTTNYYWRSNGYLETTSFTATLKYKYDYAMRNTFMAWMKYWGLGGSFEAFWNMIPFSFLVDYFVRIGNSIHAMEHDPNVDLTQYVYGESLKTRYRWGWSTNGDPRLIVLVLDDNVLLKARGDKLSDRLLSGIEGSIYTRNIRTPYYGPATPRLKLPSNSQTLNMCALLRCLL